MDTTQYAFIIIALYENFIEICHHILISFAKSTYFSDTVYVYVIWNIDFTREHFFISF